MPTLDSTLASPEPPRSTQRRRDHCIWGTSIRRILFLASWLAIVAGCRDLPKRRAPPGTDVIVTDAMTNTGWDLVISSHSRVSQGEPVEVTITCRNTTSSSLAFPLGSIWSTFDIKLVDNEQILVRRTRFGEHIQRGSAEDGVVPLTVPAMKSFSRTLLLNRLYDMTYPDLYKLVLTKQMPTRTGDSLATLESNEIVINIDF